MRTGPIRTGILIFDAVEVLDFCGPFEVFSVARLGEADRRESASPFGVTLVGASRDPVTAKGGMTVHPQQTLEDCPPLDLLVVPGGYGVRPLLEDPRWLRWVGDRAARTPTVASVCTGSLLLAAAGALDGRRATTHWWVLDELRARFPAVTVVRDRHFVRDGAFWTAAGIAAGIDLALRLVAHFCGESVARATARYMEYPYPEDDRRRIAF